MPLLLHLLVACDQAAPDPAPVAEDPCPEISIEGLVGEWGKVSGSQFDQSYRFKVNKDGDVYSGWYVGGGFKKVHMKGELRAEDLMLTQDKVLGPDPITRIYVQPHKPKCAMRVVEVRLTADADGNEKETQVGAGYVEYVAMPKEPRFTYRPCDGQAFVAKAATDWKVAKKELDEGVNPVTALGEEVAVSAWSVADEDGDASCSFDMDLYFDDRPVEGEPQPAGQVNGEGRRQWPATFRAPYSGNHHFELYRYRSCGGERELIGVACIEAILD